MRTIKFIIFTLLLNISLFAGGGSVYSRYGLGDVYFGVSARTLGMGGLGIAQADNYLNNLNPAGWNRIKFTRFETGLSYMSQKLEDQSGSSSFTDFSFMGFSFGLPLEKDLGLSLVGGLQPVSNVQYDISDVKTDGSNQYEEYFNGEGGLSKAFIGVSYRLPFDVALGTSFEYYSGTNKYISGFDFPNDADSYAGEYITKLQFNGIGWNFGIISNNFSELLNLNFIDDLRVGITFNVVGNLTTDSLLTSKSIITSSSYYSDTLAESSVYTDMPDRFGAGLSMKIEKNYTITLDYLTQYWSDFSIDGKKSVGLRNLNKYSFGFEYNRNATPFSSFWEQIVFRGGLSFENTQYRIKGKGIDQLAFSAGFSLPVGFSSSLDIGLQYGYRGTTDSGLLKEKFLKADVSLSFGELWFFRQDR